MGADLYQNEVGSWRMGNDGVSEERKNKTQCAIALGEWLGFRDRVQCSKLSVVWGMFCDSLD